MASDAPNELGQQPLVSTRIFLCRTPLGQLGKQSSLPPPASSPSPRHGQLGIYCRFPCRLEGLELLDAADKGRVRHAAAHLAGIIPPFRLEGNGRRESRCQEIGHTRAPIYSKCRIPEARPRAILN